MSFLNSNNAEYLSARITQKGRMAIAKGDFKIEYFQIGDSEFDYSTSLTNQKVFSPLDKEGGVKYPFLYKNGDTDLTTYGTPISNYLTPVPLRNAMSPAGFVSYSYAPTIECSTQKIPFTRISGSTSLVVTTGNDYQTTNYITVVFKPFSGATNTITGKTNSLVYRILSISGNTLTLDRSLPNLSGLTGNVEVVCNKCLLPELTDDTQLDPWTMNIVWDKGIIGTTSDDESLTGYTSNIYQSTKQFLGYTTSSGQTFVSAQGLSSTGFTITGTSFANSMSTGSTDGDDIIMVTPEDQRTIAIIHYSELGDIDDNPERFFKYDDYISSSTLTGSTVAIDKNGDDISDLEYFEVYIPFILYHRTKCFKKIKVDVTTAGSFRFKDCNGDDFNLSLSVGNNQIITGNTFNNIDISTISGTSVYTISEYTEPNTIGAKFTMDSTPYFVKSKITTTKQSLEFRYLLDENGYKVGKVFINNKIIVFDDQELVAVLDYRSNRKYTLPSPRVYATPTNSTASNSMLPGTTGTTGHTVWITYMLEYTGNTKLNSLPCNYFNKVSLRDVNGGCTMSTPSNVSFKFGDSTISEFGFLNTNTTGITEGFVANKFSVLVQIVTGATETPEYNKWRKIDLTSEVGGDESSLISISGFIGKTFTITNTQYVAASSNVFDLETHFSGLATNYLGDTSSTTQPQFGDEQPFPGSIKLVRASDIEQMNFLINLPTGTFGDWDSKVYQQNPTFVRYDSATRPNITEVALLNSNKESLVVAKTPTPIKRNGAQVFAVKLDF